MQKKRASKIALFGPVSSLSEARALLKEAGDAVMVVRGRPRNFVLMCPCDCNELLIINLDPQTGRAWRAYNRKNGFSLYPSIWRETGCKSHFIIAQNNIWWCEWEENYNVSEFDSHLQQLILPHLGADKLVSFEEIAEKVDEVPWLVLVTCRDLVRKGLAREGKGKERAFFGREKE